MEIDITEFTDVRHAGVAWPLVLIVAAEQRGLLVHCFIVDARKDEQNSLI